jgi:hypothetical protein
MLGHSLEDLSEIALVDYYRCEACGHAWTTPKGKCDPASDVSALKR